MPVVLLAALLEPLAEVCAFVFVIGCLLVIDAFVTAILGTLAGFSVHIPFIGNPTASAIHKAEQAVSNALGKAESFFDSRIGAALHTMARLVDWVGREIKGHSNLLWTLTALLAGSATVTELQTLLRGIRAAIHANAGTATHAIRRVHNAETRLQHGIGDDVLPRIRHAEHEIGRVIGHDLPAIRAREGRLEHGAVDTWKWIRTHPLSLATAAFTGAVAVALGRLGGGWIRCKNWNRIGRAVCGVPLGLLEELLADTLTAFAVADLCEFAAAAQGLARTIRPVLMELVDVEDALVGCHGATRPPDFVLPAADLPPTNLDLPLAA